MQLKNLIVVSVIVGLALAQSNITAEICLFGSATDANLTSLVGNPDIDFGLKNGTLGSACGNVEPNLIAQDDRIIFVPPQLFRGGLSCGACLSITASPSNVTEVYRITDQINVQQLEVSVNQFGLLGGAQIQFFDWQVVACPNDTIGGELLSYSFTQGSTDVASSLIFYAATPVDEVEISRNGKLVSLNISVGAWALPSGVQEVPFNVTVTSITGEQLEFTIDTILSNKTDIISTEVQFERQCAVFIPPPPPTTATPVTTAAPVTTVPAVSDSPVTTQAPAGGATPSQHGSAASVAYLAAIYALLVIV